MRRYPARYTLAGSFGATLFSGKQRMEGMSAGIRLVIPSPVVLEQHFSLESGAWRVYAPVSGSLYPCLKFLYSFCAH